MDDAKITLMIIAKQSQSFFSLLSVLSLFDAAIIRMNNCDCMASAC